MIKTANMILAELDDYASPHTKLSRDSKNGNYIRIVRGLYETDKTVSPWLLAGSIYGPSYISFEYALSWYGLIPEAVYAVTCATFEKKKKKEYRTPFGTFTYRDVPSDAFPLYLEVRQEKDYWYRIAAPEKALCDKLYTMPPVRNVRELSELLFDDLRIEEEELRKLNREIINDLSEKYHSVNVKKLCTLMRRIQK